MTDDDVLASLTWHFMVGNDHLTPAQWAEHKQRRACLDCEDRDLAMVIAIDGMTAPGPDHPASQALSRDEDT